MKDITDVQTGSKKLKEKIIVFCANLNTKKCFRWTLAVFGAFMIFILVIGFSNLPHQSFTKLKSVYDEKFNEKVESGSDDIIAFEESLKYYIEYKSFFNEAQYLPDEKYNLDSYQKKEAINEYKHNYAMKRIEGEGIDSSDKYATIISDEYIRRDIIVNKATLFVIILLSLFLLILFFLLFCNNCKIKEKQKNEL